MRHLSTFCNVLSRLKEGATVEEPYSTLEQAGIAALFSLCYEESWKLLKEVLEHHGLVPRRTGSPRYIIKMACDAGILENGDAWLDLMASRNQLSPIYDAELSLGIIRKAYSLYVPLFDSMKAALEKDWLDYQ